MLKDSQAMQRGQLVSRLRPPSSLAAPAVAGKDPEEDGYDPERDMFDEEQRALEADAIRRRRGGGDGGPVDGPLEDIPLNRVKSPVDSEVDSNPSTSATARVAELWDATEDSSAMMNGRDKARKLMPPSSRATRAQRDLDRAHATSRAKKKAFAPFEDS